MALHHSSFTIEQVAKLDAAEIVQLKMVFAAAFDRDLFTSVVTDKDHEFVGDFWYSIILAGLLAGEVFVAKDEKGQIVGAAAWFPPGRKMYDSEDQRREALSILLTRFSESLNAWWMTQFLPKYDEFDIKSFGEGKKLNSWHLQAIGVHPEHQRKGIARAMINEVGKKATLNKTDLCLETQDETNVEIYKKLGFSVKGETTIEGNTGSFPMWYMLREIE